MTAPTTDDRRPTDTIRDAFEAMIAFLTILIGGPMPRAWPEIAAVAARAIDSWARTAEGADRAVAALAVAALASLRDLIQRAAEEYNRRASAAAADMPAERIREMRERCDKATPGPWAVRDEGREGIGIDQAGINNIGSDRFILNEGANGTRADLDFAAHAREDLPAAIAEIERLQGQLSMATGLYHAEQRAVIKARAEIERLTADVATLELKLADAQGEHGRLTAELAARAPTDASLEARAKYAATVYDSCGNDATDSSDEQAWIAVVRAVDASRPAAPEVDAEDLWSDYRTGRGTVFASDRKAFLAGVAAGRRTREPDMGAPADASRPGLTEEQIRALVKAAIEAKCAQGMADMRVCIAEHELTCAIAAALLRASRGETFEVRHPDGTRDRVEPPDPRATLHDGNPESPFAPGSLAAGSATEDRILDRKRGGK